MGYLITILVTDSHFDDVFVYEIDSDWNDEAIWDFLHSKGHSWMNTNYTPFKRIIVKDNNRVQVKMTIKKDGVYDTRWHEFINMEAYDHFTDKLINNNSFGKIIGIHEYKIIIDEKDKHS